MTLDRLDVWRTLGDGSQCYVGTLAQNKQGIFFQYHSDYVAQHSNISPFDLNFDNTLQLAEKKPHNGLHGVFSDSLPDGWGMMLMDRVFRKADILPSQVTPMDRLAFIGDRGMGALSYRPVSPLQTAGTEKSLNVGELGLKAQALFDGHTTDVLAELINAGSSGGARPKAQLYLHKHNTSYCSTQPAEGSKAHLVKFTSSQLALGHEEGLCEAVYLTLAKQAGIDVPSWKLIEAPKKSGAQQWLALERFDVTKGQNNTEGRLHLHSACGLLGADYRLPSLDYMDLIKASSLLCKSPAVGQTQFKRAVFNLFALNQDDHSKNWAFLQGDNGQWHPAPFYDVTFSPSPYGEHATAFNGFGTKPELKVIQALATQANFSSWKQAQIVIKEVVDALQAFESVATGLGVSKRTIRLMQKQLNTVYTDNRRLT